MSGQNHGAWAEYAREQRTLRRRETQTRVDVTGAEALDHILLAIAEGRSLLPGEARRASASSERRERAQESLRTRHAPSHEDDLRYRDGAGPERRALLHAALARLPDRTVRILALDAQGFAGREVGRRSGLGEAAVRQSLSRAVRRLSA